MSRNANTSASLPPDSHTARRLEHATPEHLHRTTRRVFIGPIPEGWLKSHRKEWYRSYVGYRGNRQATFTASTRTVPTSSSHNEAASSSTDGGQVPSPEPRFSSQSGDVVASASEGPTSTTSLLRGQASQRLSTISDQGPATQPTGDDAAPAPSSEPTIDSILQNREGTSRVDRVASKLPVPKVRFTEAGRLQLRARASRLATRGTFRSSKTKDGEMMKVDKMLIRADITQQSPRDYDEKLSQAVETKAVDKWREFMVVCRKHSEDDAEAVLQFYQTRVIQVSEGEKVKKAPKVELLLSNSRTHVNLFSALDKTLCIWSTGNRRTTIYYLRAPSTASAVEWYTFLRGVLGHGRAKTLQVNIPDLSVSLRLDDPFRSLEASQTLAQAAEGDDEALARAVNDEKGAAGAIVSRCMEMLKQSPEWSDVLKSWAQHDRVGLAWKRYDRLEWIYGQVEQRMYGTIAMQQTHDLELRPKDHYPMTTKPINGPVLKEPPPVEGFLIRLTSQKGKEQKLGRMMFKRLYFSTYNQYLVFIQPAKATPPPPPRTPDRSDNASSVPSARELSTQAPLAYEVEPYPLDGDQIAWLDTEGVKSAKEQEAHDKEAASEAERNMKMMFSCDGFIDLCDIRAVRDYTEGASPADDNIDEGEDVDFHVQVDNSLQDDGQTTEVDSERVFELVMKNGLIIRLQAFNKQARNEWRRRLRQLTTYWTSRSKADMDLYKLTREQNLRELGIDERAEAVVGQFAYKWEVGKSFASPTLYNMCGITECRTIHLSGTLFRKPRKHTTFERCHVILSHGHLLIFQDLLRKRTGKRLSQIHHERIAAISLQGCYLYSGLLTENDLLYQNQTFDSNTPGHNALPRIYLEDGWTSTDEDAMTTFVIWHAKSNSWFKSASTVDDIKKQEDSESGKNVRTKLTRVSQLGATGRTVVFKARSRAERDHWVLALQVEIERQAAQNDEVRLVDDNKKT